MPVDVNSFADVALDWEGLLTAVEASPELAKDFESLRVPLQQALGEARSLKAQQDAQVAAKQETTRQIKAVLARGRDLAIHLRAAVRGKIGPRSEQLVQFGVTPMRKRTRRSAAKAKKAPSGAANPQPVE